MNYAILLSGGTGTRIRSDIPKQYLRAGSFMMVTLALKTLLDCDAVEKIFIVAAPGWRKEIEDDANCAGLDMEKIGGFADPGANRQLSIVSGMKEILQASGEDVEDPAFSVEGPSTLSDTDTVLVHDAARPFLTNDLLEACYSALPGHDGVMPVLPMKDTVYLSDDKISVSELLDRSKIFAGQAPELFRFKKYYSANMALSLDEIMKINGASEPAILFGMDIAMIPGDENNFKITTMADLDRFGK